MKKTITLISLILCLSICLTACSHSGAATINLMEGITPQDIDDKKTDYVFTLSQYEVSVKTAKELFKDNKNVMFSPLSLSIAGGLVMNGAEGETKAKLESFFCPFYSAEKNNLYMKHFLLSLGGQVRNASSIWYKNDERLAVNKDFLQKNADYFGADAFKVAFDDNGKAAINDWVKNKTNGSIDSILDEIDKDSMMFLINALTFESEWQNQYSEMSVSSATFKGYDQNYSVEMMKSTEDMYIEYGGATGFIKPYKDANYLFVALLPNENITLSRYAETLNGEKLKNTIESASETTVYASLPKFNFKYSFTADEILKKNGAGLAFDQEKANFSAMGKVEGGNLYIDEILQKTYIRVTEKGTVAGAATKVEMANKTSLSPDTKTVTLDRPFMFMILQAETKIPVFVGAVNNF